MGPEEKADYEKQSQELRLDLKKWETKWAQEHEGKKPGRGDIKHNPDIAQKYKAYNKIRDILAGKSAAPKQPDAEQRKRKSIDDASTTPSKRVRTAQTPQAHRRHAEAAVTPATTRKLFSPVVPTSIGPTPQRDGRVLGLFDVLVGLEAATPSRSTGEGDEAKVHATPSKQTACLSGPESAIKLNRTPMSSSKRHFLNSFMTPLKKRDGNILGAKTPTSISKQFATPAFLRRAPLPAVDENREFTSPEPIRLPRKPLMRGLSSVVASLRKLEEDKLDDDLEALHDMENEASLPPPKPKEAEKVEDILVKDSQRPQLLGGFDDEAMYDSAPEEALGRDGQPLRVFKKKGQKRTTRRVNIKPTRNKRPAAAERDESSSDEEEDVIPETQAGPTEMFDGADDSLLSGSEFDGTDGEDLEEEKNKKKEKKEKRKKEKKKQEKETEKTAKKDGKIKSAAKKVNELAHANFKRLKLRSHGAKGGPGFNSRFRRRR